MVNCESCLYIIGDNYCYKKEQFVHQTPRCDKYVDRANSMWLCALMCGTVEDDEYDMDEIKGDNREDDN